jgi:hypothetical protein
MSISCHARCPSFSPPLSNEGLISEAGLSPAWGGLPIRAYRSFGPGMLMPLFLSMIWFRRALNNASDFCGGGRDASLFVSTCALTNISSF